MLASRKNNSMTKEQKDQKMRMLAYVVIRELLKPTVDPHTFIEYAEDAAIDLGLIVVDDEGVMSGVRVDE
jgi:hypothetical protein